MIEKAKLCPTIGMIPSSYFTSMTYEEQLLWLCKKMNEIIDFANNNLSEQLKEFINNEFNNMIINTMYETDTETLVLYLERNK